MSTEPLQLSTEMSTGTESVDTFVLDPVCWTLFVGPCLLDPVLLDPVCWTLFVGPFLLAPVLLAPFCGVFTCPLGSSCLITKGERGRKAKSGEF